MLNWIEPRFSKTRVKQAGKNIRKGEYSLEDVLVLENWRASHAYILNTFQAALRRRSRNKKITVAQRLKRRHTIFDKLVREPDMQLSTMHDIAGCRVIFQNQDELRQFRTSMHNSRAKHKLVTGNDEKYNYITNPKSSGYRGIHDIYEYDVASVLGPKWNGLRIEIQYRTIFQHAWATAVEVADIITTNRIKFSQSDKDYRDFFRHASEIIARAFEKQNSCLPELTDTQLVERFQSLDDQLGLLRAFTNLQKTGASASFKPNTLLIFHTAPDTGHRRLDIESFDTVNKAITKYEELEKELADTADIVLVRAENEASIRDAFRNYFSDTNEFVSFISDGIKLLKNSP